MTQEEWSEYPDESKKEGIPGENRDSAIIIDERGRAVFVVRDAESARKVSDGILSHDNDPSRYIKHEISGKPIQSFDAQDNLFEK